MPWRGTQGLGWAWLGRRLPDGAPVHQPGLGRLQGPDPCPIGAPLQVAKPTAARSSRRSTVVRLEPAARRRTTPTPTLPCAAAGNLGRHDQRLPRCVPSAVQLLSTAVHAAVPPCRRCARSVTCGSLVRPPLYLFAASAPGLRDGCRPCSMLCCCQQCVSPGWFAAPCCTADEG